MRSLAEESEAELGGRLSVLQREKQDHVVLDRLLEELRRSSGYERALPDGEELTSRVEEEHQAVNAAVARLEQTDPDVAEHPARVQGGQR